MRAPASNFWGAGPIRCAWRAPLPLYTGNRLRGFPHVAIGSLGNAYNADGAGGHRHCCSRLYRIQACGAHSRPRAPRFARLCSPGALGSAVSSGDQARCSQADRAPQPLSPPLIHVTSEGQKMPVRARSFIGGPIHVACEGQTMAGFKRMRIRLQKVMSKLQDAYCLPQPVCTGTKPF